MHSMEDRRDRGRSLKIPVELHLPLNCPVSIILSQQYVMIIIYALEIFYVNIWQYFL